jgi:hypothetical protein
VNSWASVVEIANSVEAVQDGRIATPTALPKPRPIIS